MKRRRMNALVLGLGFGFLAASPLAFGQNEQPGQPMPAPESEMTGGEEGLEDIGPTVEYIESLMALPPAAQLGREADEDLENPRNLFENEQVREALLGETPRFVYFPVGVDPMIIPWVRNQIVVRERADDARKLLESAQQEGERDLARQALDLIDTLDEDYPEAAAAENIEQLRGEIVAFIESPQTDQIVQGPGAEIQEPKVELPPWIPNNTRGVLLDRENPRQSSVLVGDFILGLGDRIERFPLVVVKEILPQQVIYEYQDTEFIVQVEPY